MAAVVISFAFCVFNLKAQIKNSIFKYSSLLTLQFVTCDTAAETEEDCDGVQLISLEGT